MKKQCEVKIPEVPNFIKIKREVLSISEFSDEELKNIGEEWIIKLIKKARKKRYDYTK